MQQKIWLKLYMQAKYYQAYICVPIIVTDSEFLSYIFGVSKTQELYYSFFYYTSKCCLTDIPSFLSILHVHRVWHDSTQEVLKGNHEETLSEKTRIKLEDRILTYMCIRFISFYTYMSTIKGSKLERDIFTSVYEEFAMLIFCLQILFLFNKINALFDAIEYTELVDFEKKIGQFEIINFKLNIVYWTLRIRNRPVML